MKLFKFIIPVCIAVLALVQCTNPQTTYTKPTYYVEQPAAVNTRSNNQAPLSAQISSAVPIGRENTSVAGEKDRGTTSLSVPKSNHGEIHYYTNAHGNRVQAPTYYDAPPAGACAQCEDGTYSFSQNRRGTCSRHGGVRVWLK